MADYGAEIIMLFPETALRGFTPGINITYAPLGILSPTAGSGRGEIRKFPIGLIVPLKDKDGENTINIVPFFERKKYVDFNKRTSDFWAIKFSLPFKNFLR